MNYQDLLDGLVQAQPAPSKPTQADIDKRLFELKALHPAEHVTRVTSLNNEYVYSGYDIVREVQYVTAADNNSILPFDEWVEKNFLPKRILERFGDGYFVICKKEQSFRELREQGKLKEARDKILRDNQFVAGEPMLKVGYIVKRSGQKFVTHRFKATKGGMEAVKIVLENDQYQHGNTQHDETVCNYVDHLDPKTIKVTPVFRSEWKTFDARDEPLGQDKPRVIGWGWGRD